MGPGVRSLYCQSCRDPLRSEQQPSARRAWQGALSSGDGDFISGPLFSVGRWRHSLNKFTSLFPDEQLKVTTCIVSCISFVDITDSLSFSSPVLLPCSPLQWGEVTCPVIGLGCWLLCLSWDYTGLCVGEALRSWDTWRGYYWRPVWVITLNDAM